MADCDVGVSSLLSDSDCSSVSLSVSVLSCNTPKQQAVDGLCLKSVAVWKLKLWLGYKF